jgi:hypothetical protein
MALPALVARGTVVRVMLRTVVRVEGASDGAAVETLAARRGLDLAAAGAAVVTMGGAGGADRSPSSSRRATWTGSAPSAASRSGEDGPPSTACTGFWGTTAGRKEHYGRALAAAAPAEPPPIAALLDHVAARAVPVRTGRAPR